jgi:hypothetical protein
VNPAHQLLRRTCKHRQFDFFQTTNRQGTLFFRDLELACQEVRLGQQELAFGQLAGNAGTPKESVRHVTELLRFAMTAQLNQNGGFVYVGQKRPE